MTISFAMIVEAIVLEDDKAAEHLISRLSPIHREEMEQGARNLTAMVRAREAEVLEKQAAEAAAKAKKKAARKSPRKALGKVALALLPQVGTQAALLEDAVSADEPLLPPTGRRRGGALHRDRRQKAQLALDSLTPLPFS